MNFVKNMSAAKGLSVSLIMVALLPLRLFAQTNEVPIVGHYVYEHAWRYAVGEDSMFCSEVGTMDYEADGSALDHAIQTYLLKHKDGSKVVWIFDYFSPSFWHRRGDDFFFKGDSAAFSMKLLSNIMESNTNVDSNWYQNYADGVVKGVSQSIAHETKFHIAELSACRFVWSYTYRDEHTDYWEFLRPQYSK